MRLHQQLTPSIVIDAPIARGVHPVIKLMLQRLKSGSRRGQRDDGRIVALAIEGGGFRGATSGGMCVILEAAGLIDTVDVIYGTSSGALNGAFTAAGQAALGLTNYVDTANKQFFNPVRILTKRRVVNFDYLEAIIRNRKPLNEQAFANGPEFRAMAVDPAKRSVEVLKNFANADELLQAVRVSCALPYVTGPIPKFRGRAMIDGGILEPIPYASALAEGATDVLVLRSRPASLRRKKRTPEFAQKALQKRSLPLAALAAENYQVYNAQAAELERLSKQSDNVYQITPAESMPTVQLGEKSLVKIRAGAIAGAQAAATAFHMPTIDLYWHPIPYTIK